MVERLSEDGKPAGAIVINTRNQPATYRNADSAAKTLAGYAVEILPVPSAVQGVDREAPNDRKKQ